MKKITTKLFLIVLCLALALSLTGCAAKGKLTDPLLFDTEHQNIQLDSFVAAENERYQLKWDSENKRIIVHDKIENVDWSNTPLEYLNGEILDEDGEPAVPAPKMDTTVLVEYIETQNFTIKTANLYVQSLNRETYTIEKIENGFKITYYLDKLGISIPVCYVLKDDGFSITIDPSQICEDGTNLVYRVQVAPFMCSVPNIAEDSYLFYPSGSGALIYANKEYEVGLSNEYKVYGDDSLYIPVVSNYVSNTETIKLPVFGAKNGNRALLGVISEGAEMASLYTDIGDSNFGYSTVYPIFYIRGKQTTKKAINNATQYSEQYTSAPIAIDFYPLYNEDSDYVGMANKYREHLIKNEGLKDLEEKASVSVSLVGGTLTPDSFLGVPTTTLYATTTVNQAGEILKDIDAGTDLSIVADLFGFGSSGIDIGKPAGNLKIGGNIGNEKQVKALAQLCNESGIDLFFNYDLMTFSSNGLGLTTTRGGSAKGPSHTYSKKSAYYLAHGSINSSLSYYHIGRLELEEIAGKAISKTKSLGVKGFSARNITNSYYSDYADNRYIAGGNMGNDVAKIYNSAKESGLSVLGYSANDYAAVVSDYVIEAPIHSNFYNLFDEDIPFYQIVFKGYVPAYGVALNTVTDQNLAILRCVESGVGLRYSVMNNYSVDLLTSNYQIFHSSLYSDLKDGMLATINEHAGYYNAISDAKMVDHIIVNDNVRKIVYDNGVNVYVNYGKEAYESEDGSVAAKSYIFVTKGAEDNA